MATATGLPPIFIDAATVRSTLTYKSLIRHLQNSLPAATTSLQSPLRHTHNTSSTSSLLLMPSWSLSPSLPYTGIKIVTHHPHNSTLNLPSIHANYVLFNSLTGQTLASIDGTELTLHRTSCVSALASHFLSREDSETLLMIGAGSLAPHLIKAHLTARPNINKVLVWNRRVENAKTLVEKLRNEGDFVRVCFEVSEGGLEEAVAAADVVSCATNSETALVAGSAVKGGAHVDLVGSFTPSMRECDDEAIRRGRVFVDCDAAVEEAGELVGALERGVIGRSEILGNLVDLIKREKIGRRDSEEITVFKSVGSAVVDLLSAQLVYETLMKKKDDH
ncbi:Ornithine cyclodeaminase/mu-crystallin protein [Actinidia chinensis var. chinensis]|uniref:Ornithine cyclodeaminase/mu-crystallin protein n=1 Tax=Actinidia chinensis var. chinensis TaxID=1590841 RepID=A0A2R6Q915_ACTCC|nr:Ornithine cyclodeaminase/mu-crystallin protein [Actinidia chinensis var. chinensis]